MNAADLPVHVDTPLFSPPRPLPVRWLYIANQIGVLPAAVALIQNHARWPDGALDIRWASLVPFMTSEVEVLDSLWRMQIHGMIRYRREPTEGSGCGRCSGVLAGVSAGTTRAGTMNRGAGPTIRGGTRRHRVAGGLCGAAESLEPGAQRGRSEV